MTFSCSHCSRQPDVDLPSGATGGFQKYVVVQKSAIAELPYKIPSSVGVVLPLAISTAAAGLYQKDYLKLPLPTPEGKPKPLDRALLIWGGSSSVGTLAVQLATASGAHVIAVASSRNHDFVKSLGAKSVFDYNSSAVSAEVAKAVQAAGGDFVGALPALDLGRRGPRHVVLCCASTHLEQAS